MPDALSAADVGAVLSQAKARATGSAPGAAPFASPADWRDTWIYFLMLDRFNNPSAPPKHQPWDDPHFDQFQGGTYAGVEQQLKYIHDLGAGAIWLSPALKNLQWDDSMYHGYGIHDFLRAEPRFASVPDKADDELRHLVDAAHGLGLYVIFDIVLNHTGDVFGYGTNGHVANFTNDVQNVFWRDQHGVAQPNQTSVEAIANPSRDATVWPAELRRDAFFRRQGEMQDTIGDFGTLRQFRTDNTELQSFLLRAYQYVIARFDCDGFRIDTLRYLLPDLPRLLGNATREFALSIGKRNFFTFGEVFDQNAEQDIARFIGRNTTRDSGDLVGVDAALDFPLVAVLPGVLKGFAPAGAVSDMYQLRKSIEQDIVSSHGDATRFFVTFLDNHDLKHRFYFVKSDEPRRFDDQLSMAVACLFALQGIPCLYYGTEQGLHGAGNDDASVREALWGRPGTPFDTQAPFYTQIQKIARVRSLQPALRYGRQYMRPISGDGRSFGVSRFMPGVLAFSRILVDDEVVVVANASDQPGVPPLSVIVDANLNPVGSTFQVLYSNKSTTTPPGQVQDFGRASPVTVLEVDGSVSHGPLNAITVTLQPLEIQIVGRTP